MVDVGQYSEDLFRFRLEGQKHLEALLVRLVLEDSVVALAEDGFHLLLRLDILESVVGNQLVDQMRSGL